MNKTLFELAEKVAHNLEIPPEFVIYSFPKNIDFIMNAKIIHVMWYNLNDDNITTKFELNEIDKAVEFVRDLLSK